MLAHARTHRRDRALLTVLVDTGARRGELAHVDYGDVDLASGTITFRISKTRARTVVLSDRAIVAVRAWMVRRGKRPGNLWTSADPHSWSTPSSCATRGHAACPRPAPGLRRAMAGARRQRTRLDARRWMVRPVDGEVLCAGEGRPAGRRRNAAHRRLTPGTFDRHSSPSARSGAARSSPHQQGGERRPPTRPSPRHWVQ